ncbi:hypothetical protein RHSIM_Rhsim05G0173400 [Rhododendron simsii]|uniref:Leucine-rich repeat-containing N-terminal plant-type domain-containing protein n=1 Tax=Rhododendron simsii TaxID=118357 RepID=A0A834H851_RHOSS|nr:hypothetical protein RHSIM_Rhsim05G0173400 [Rhododendron simsii]
MRMEFITWFFSITTTLTILSSITIPVHSQCLEDQKSLLLQLKNSLRFDPDSSVKLVNWAGTNDCCQWNGVTCDHFGRVIGLDLNTESISGDKGTATLSVLNLQNNNLTGNIMGTFPKGCTLRTLELNGNNFEGEVPNSLANCANAEVLNLGTNNINGNFPCFLANLSELRILVLRSNKFHGNIGCRGIHNYLWPKLQIIDLALNNFSGILPPNFFSQRKAMMDGGCTLRTLELNGNNFEGEVPKSLANCANAEVLNLVTNNINGNFPCFLTNLSELRILVLRSNKFHGNIGCRGIHNYLWPKLQIIDLALNNFSGILPPNFISQRKAMMDGGNRQPNANHLRFDFSQNIYYEDSVAVINKGLLFGFGPILVHRRSRGGDKT